MPTVVIPFAGVDGKTRLHASRRARRELSLAMLGDVLAAAAPVGEVRIVTGDGGGAAIAREFAADVVPDPGGGQGAAVEAALAGLDPGAILVVNADVPCVVPGDLRALLAATPAGGVALVEALDGTTNALSISAPELFAPLYGPGSAARFRATSASSASRPSCRTSPTTSTRSTIFVACTCGSGRARRPRSGRSRSRWCREGRRALGRRRRRTLRARCGRRGRPAGGHRRRQRR